MKPCIKCSNLYNEPDIEPYLCPPCLEEKKEIAKKIDLRFPHKPDDSPYNKMSPDERFAQYFMGNVLRR